MHNIPQQISRIQHTIAAITSKHHRPPQSVQLLAVSKKHSALRIAEAFSAGQTAFGENYLQEARDKQNELQDLPIVWHFIGPIQSNKTREIAENFAWVHSVDRLKIATRLSQQRPEYLPPLNICIQINCDNEASKAGVTLEALPELVDAISQLPRLQLRGLMAIPAKRENMLEQQRVFQSLSDTLALLNQLDEQEPTPRFDTLSMGMSDDMEAAIAAGSTMVRIGSAIFGART